MERRDFFDLLLLLLFAPEITRLGRWLQGRIPGGSSPKRIPGLAGAAAITAGADSFLVAGLQFHVSRASAGLIRPDEAVRLVREPHNPHDPHAVAIVLGLHQIGYVPRQRNRALAEAMDRGAEVVGVIEAVDPDAPLWEAVQVRVAWG